MVEIGSDEEPEISASEPIPVVEIPVKIEDPKIDDPANKYLFGTVKPLFDCMYCYNETKSTKGVQGKLLCSCHSVTSHEEYDIDFHYYLSYRL
jgi:hypothetical protein